MTKQFIIDNYEALNNIVSPEFRDILWNIAMGKQIQFFHHTLGWVNVEEVPGFNVEGYIFQSRDTGRYRVDPQSPQEIYVVGLFTFKDKERAQVHSNDGKLPIVTYREVIDQ